MSWIDIIEPEEAEGKLKEIYKTIAGKRGKVSNIMKVHSLNPEAMLKHLELYMQLMFGRSGLTRLEREAIAVAVSEENNCDYCLNHHRVALKSYTKNKKNLTTEKNKRINFLVEFAKKLTKDPSNINEKAIIDLRSKGFSDREILDLVLITAYFNFVNRIALGLGVTFNQDELSGYRV